MAPGRSQESDEQKGKNPRNPRRHVSEGSSTRLPCPHARWPGAPLAPHPAWVPPAATGAWFCMPTPVPLLCPRHPAPRQPHRPTLRATPCFPPHPPTHSSSAAAAPILFIFFNCKLPDTFLLSVPPFFFQAAFSAELFCRTGQGLLYIGSCSILK